MHKCTYFLINTHYYLFRTLFFLKQNRRRPLPTGLTQGFVCQDSCACTRFLCMHKILVHAQHSCACTTLLCMHWKGQGPRPGPKQKAPPRAGPAAPFSLGPGHDPWPLQCMHKIVVHAQECCACTKVLCMHKNLVHAQESWAQTQTSVARPSAASGGFFFRNKRRVKKQECTIMRTLVYLCVL